MTTTAITKPCDPTHAGPAPASPPQAGGGNEGRGRKGRKKGKEGGRPPIPTGGMGGIGGVSGVPSRKKCYSTGKRAASIGTRPMAAAEHTLSY